MSWPYREQGYPHYWGPQTAAENYCEEDYIISPYVAEFINTLSNILYIIFAAHGLSRTWGSWDRSLPHIGLFAVGVGSGMFHLSLREWPQLSDSLSMIYATALVLHRVLTFSMLSPSQRVVTLSISAGVLIFSAIHCAINDLNVHSAVFASMLLVIVWRTSGITRRVGSEGKRKEMLGWVRVGGACAVFGYGLWLTDVFACPTLKWMKRSVGLPWGFAFELHGWWHVLTAVAAHIFMVLVDELTTMDLEPETKVK